MKLKQFTAWLSKTNIFYFALVMCVLAFAVRLPYSIITEIFNITDISFDGKLPETRFTINLHFLYRTLIKAPLLETLLFQSLFFFIYRVFEINKWIMITISALAFASTHYYSLHYMIGTFFVGFLFMYGYTLRGDNKKRPFLSIALAHCFTNIISATAIFINQNFFMQQ